jgi:hypothetical protein
MNMCNRIINLKNSSRNIYFHYLNIRPYSDTTVRVRFAPSPTGKYFINFLQTNKINTDIQD